MCSSDYDALVVKASGLAAGKGVTVAKDKKEAWQAARAMLTDGQFGSAGSSVVVEELLQGQEISVSVLLLNFYLRSSLDVWDSLYCCCSVWHSVMG